MLCHLLKSNQYAVEADVRFSTSRRAHEHSLRRLAADKAVSAIDRAYIVSIEAYLIATSVSWPCVSPHVIPVPCAMAHRTTTTTTTTLRYRAVLTRQKRRFQFASISRADFGLQISMWHYRMLCL